MMFKGLFQPKTFFDSMLWTVEGWYYLFCKKKYKENWKKNKPLFIFPYYLNLVCLATHLKFLK